MQKLLGQVRRCVEDYRMMTRETRWPWAYPAARTAW